MRSKWLLGGISRVLIQTNFAELGLFPLSIHLIKEFIQTLKCYEPLLRKLITLIKLIVKALIFNFFSFDGLINGLKQGSFSCSEVPGGLKSLVGLYLTNQASN